MKFNEAIKNWLLFDLYLAIILWAVLGTEGMARMACQFVDHEACGQLEQP